MNHRGQLTASYNDVSLNCVISVCDFKTKFKNRTYLMFSYQMVIFKVLMCLLRMKTFLSGKFPYN